MSMTRVLLALGAVLVLTLAMEAQQSTTIILSTTASTQDSGLLDVLVPMFERKTGDSVKTISVGAGPALALAARGEAISTRMQQKPARASRRNAAIQPPAHPSTPIT
jgi:ABC-type tungstate transport system permease subunit